MRDRGKILDQQITEILNSMDVQGIKDLLGISYEENPFDEKGLVSTEFLKRITMRRDEIVYNLREIHVENGLNFEDIKKSVELHPEGYTLIGRSCLYFFEK